MMQNKGYYAVQGHSRSPISVPIETPYVTPYYWLITNLHPILYRFKVIIDYCSNFGQKPVTLIFEPSHCGEA